MRLPPLVAIVLMFAMGLVWADDRKARRPQPVALGLPFALAPSVVGLNAVPATVSFSATDPDLGSVTGTPSTVSWNIQPGNNASTWTLTVQASAASFTGCSGVPVSAVTVTCNSATVSGGAGTGTCAGPFALLSTLSQTVAAGQQGNGNRSYTVTITFALADSWQYVGALAPPCTSILTYTVNAP